MNVYDFDGTIYRSNCTFRFALWCIRRHPGLLLRYVPKMLYSAVMMKLGRIPYYRFVRVFFGYLPMITDFDKQISAFWDKNEKYISSWYLRQKRSDDLIISASPECIVKPIADRLGVGLQATLYDRELGVLYGNLMLAKSKSRYIIDRGMPMIDNFYSDSLSDTPIALCSEHAFLVTHHASIPIPWPPISDLNRKKIRKLLNTGWRHMED